MNPTTTGTPSFEWPSALSGARHAIHPGSAEDVPLIAQALGDTRIDLAPLLALARASYRVSCGTGPLPLPSPSAPEPAWWLVRAGQVSVGERAEHGQFIEHANLQRGQWLDVAGAASAEGRWLREAVVRTDAELLALPLDALAQACGQNPAMAMALMRIAATQLHSLRDRLWQVCTASVTARVARWLLREAGSRDTWTMSEPKQTVAQHLHMTPESLSRSLRQLCDEQLITVRGYKVTLLDEAELRRRLDSGDAWPRRAERRRGRKVPAPAGA